jgi:ribosomal protein L21E
MLDTVKVTFDNGDVIITDFNAKVSREEMAKYYMGNYFNLGTVRDDMHKAVKVEFDF